MNLVRGGNPARWRSEPEQVVVRIEGISLTGLNKFEGTLFTPVEQAFTDLAIGSEHDVERVGTEAGNLDNFRYACWRKSSDPSTRAQAIKHAHSKRK